MNFFALALLLIGGIILTAGDIIMKKWVNTNSVPLFITGILIYIVGMFFLVGSYKYENIAVASAIFIIFNVVTLSIVTWLYFKEPLSVYQTIGIVLSLIAITFLELS